MGKKITYEPHRAARSRITDAIGSLAICVLVRISERAADRATDRSSELAANASNEAQVVRERRASERALKQRRCSNTQTSQRASRASRSTSTQNLREQRGDNARRRSDTNNGGVCK